MFFSFFRKPQTQLVKQKVCRLTIRTQNGTQELDIQCPPRYQNIIANISPPSLYELTRRKVYQIICDTAKAHDTEVQSIYSDLSFNFNNKNGAFHQSDINNLKTRNFASGDKNGNYEIKLTPSVLKNEKKTKGRSYYAISDIVQEYYGFLPRFMKEDLCNGPLSRCENVSCMKPIFDFVLYEFCLG